MNVEKGLQISFLMICTEYPLIKIIGIKPQNSYRQDLRQSQVVQGTEKKNRGKFSNLLGN